MDDSAVDILIGENMRFLVCTFLLTCLFGCSTPSIGIETEIPAALALRWSGVEPQESDMHLPPLRFTYHKNWYEQDLVIEFQKKTDGSFDVVLRSVTEADAAVEQAKMQSDLLKSVVGSITSVAAGRLPSAPPSTP